MPLLYLLIAQVYHTIFNIREISYCSEWKLTQRLTASPCTVQGISGCGVLSVKLDIHISLSLQVPRNNMEVTERFKDPEVTEYPS